MAERCKDLIGKRVRLTRELRLLDGSVIPIGTYGKVSLTWRGVFHLDLEVGGYVRHVGRRSFEVIGG